MTTELIIEILLIVLLSVACGYGAILNHRLRKIRTGQEALFSAIAQFDEATSLARENLETIHTRSQALEKDLGQTVSRANFLMDELSVMVPAGNNIAGRIEGAVAEVRTLGKFAARTPPPQKHSPFKSRGKGLSEPTAGHS